MRGTRLRLQHPGLQSGRQHSGYIRSQARVARAGFGVAARGGARRGGGARLVDGHEVRLHERSFAVLEVLWYRGMPKMLGASRRGVQEGDIGGLRTERSKVRHLGGSAWPRGVRDVEVQCHLPAKMSATRMRNSVARRGGISCCDVHTNARSPLCVRGHAV